MDKRINKFSARMPGQAGSARSVGAGFTLVELMVAVFLGALAVAGIYKTYVAYSTAADVQEKTLELQQNLRTTMIKLVADLRTVGFDPNDLGGGTLIPPGFSQADATSITFTRDITGGQADGINNDGDTLVDGVTQQVDEADEAVYGDGDVSDPGENIRIYVDGNFRLIREDLIAKADGIDNDANGVIDDADEYETILVDTSSTPGGGWSPVNFVFLDKDRSPLTPLPLAANNLSLVSFVQISLVLKSTNEDYSYTDNQTFRNIEPPPSGPAVVLDPQGDNFYRRQINAEVDLRNMILKQD